ncbi:acyltransferase family protein [Pseudoalteromonas sp. S16_S37]|uniref:acyltransferase family protein n=1 Tax=Pseudoalteromonas sp. S16_S37 TaxID=2720228 RepID=UPI001680F9EF|nr:acyltransferase [Pseudoalteromonas sp. S16_S37]MBD1584646.1 acyltransferase [Pseudoalteromonas sp. S16_S37]
MQIRKLNTLRALAALTVFFTHFSDITNWLGGALGGGSGAYGVMLFFLLSGFLMAHLYLDKPCNKQNITDYFLARVGRVIPLYLAIVFASYFFTQADKNVLYNIADFNTLIGHLLFIYGESVLWSIPPEVHFYLIFALLWSVSQYRKGYIYVVTIAVMLLLFFTNFPKIFGDFYGIPYNLFSILRTLPFFFIGVIFGLHYKRAEIPIYLRSHWFILALCLIPLMYPEFSPITSDAKNRMWLSYEVLFVMATVFFCIVFLVPDNNILLANRFGDFIGKISYSLYLLHMPIIEMVNTLALTVEQKLIVSLLLSIFVAYLSFRLFEKPIAKVIRKRASGKVAMHRANSAS